MDDLNPTPNANTSGLAATWKNFPQRKQSIPLIFQPRNSLLAVLSSIIPTASAQGLTPANCSFSQGDSEPGNPFPFNAWLNRGICVRTGSYAQCRVNLIAVLGDIDGIHAAEYSASASVLALLPTIGALFGTPTSEIWTLLTVLPFGGGLAMLLSFGGTIMPTRIVDYQTAFAMHGISIGHVGKHAQDYDLGTRDEDERHNLEELEEREIRDQQEGLRSMANRIKARIGRRESLGLPRNIIALGLFSMVLLFCGVQVAMGIIENGAVYSDGCTYNWWFHIWYMAVTIAAILDNWAQLPFKKHWKLYISDIPYDFEVRGGQRITSDSSSDSEQFPAQAGEPMLALTINKLKTLKPAGLRLIGPKLHTKPRNSVLVLVSVARDIHEKTFWRSVFQVFTKSASITVFVFGTCVLSAVTLLAMPMAQLVLMMVLAAGVGSRVISGGIVSAISKNEPMIHVIGESEEEAFKIMTEIFSLQQRPEVKFQVELNGHIFVEGCRVAKRSSWYRRIFGVMANAFDLQSAPKVKEYAWGDDAVQESTSHSGSRIYKGNAGVELTGLRPYEGT
ncbi:hypothetical protein G7Y89_g12354 [Cudoniella acicularis]|uniref:Uncharacterized protein n=1 Tax=Cudoniella acicularis TaxID=354080 RepID=A0A8H4RBP4_9HELO|nr:hypothetical protein G7Y89_g12354 [Cudoniella acicularis]